jgi:hypothetical protein
MPQCDCDFAEPPLGVARLRSRQSAERLLKDDRVTEPATLHPCTLTGGEAAEVPPAFDRSHSFRSAWLSFEWACQASDGRQDGVCRLDYEKSERPRG